MTLENPGINCDSHRRKLLLGYQRRLPLLCDWWNIIHLVPHANTSPWWIQSPLLQDMLEVIESCEMPTAIERWRIPQKHILLSTGLHRVQHGSIYCSIVFNFISLVFLRSISDAKLNHTKLLILQSISPNSFIIIYPRIHIQSQSFQSYSHYIYRHITIYIIIT